MATKTYTHFPISPSLDVEVQDIAGIAETDQRVTTREEIVKFRGKRVLVLQDVPASSVSECSPALVIPGYVVRERFISDLRTKFEVSEVKPVNPSDYQRLDAFLHARGFQGHTNYWTN